jgi:hypothetical protein
MQRQGAIDRSREPLVGFVAKQGDGARRGEIGERHGKLLIGRGVIDDDDSRRAGGRLDHRTEARQGLLAPEIDRDDDVDQRPRRGRPGSHGRTKRSPAAADGAWNRPRPSPQRGVGQRLGVAIGEHGADNKTVAAEAEHRGVDSETADRRISLVRAQLHPRTPALIVLDH